MKILVLGGAGMLGHKIFQRLQTEFPNTCCTIRQTLAEAGMESVSLLQQGNVIECIDAEDFHASHKLLDDTRPQVLVNCIGVIKQRSIAKNAIPSIAINALLPHKLAEWLQPWRGRLIHFSTDCVFNGNLGNYAENDVADALDLYGRTKSLGEVVGPNALTLRTSIIGRELTHFQSLLEWFLAQRGSQVSGYTRAFYSGVTTNYLAEIVLRIIRHHPQLSGLYQVTADRISKYDLLCLLRDAYSLNVEIVPQHEFFCDRSMNGQKFVAATGYSTPPWPELVAQLVTDRTPYEEWRAHAYQTI